MTCVWTSANCHCKVAASESALCDLPRPPGDCDDAQRPRLRGTLARLPHFHLQAVHTRANYVVEVYELVSFGEIQYGGGSTAILKVNACISPSLLLRMELHQMLSALKTYLRK